VVVLVPESGDGIQVMKAGLMEIADVFVVNKADRPGADRIRQEVEVALGLRAGKAFRHMQAHHGVSLKAAGAKEPPRSEVPVAWESPVLATVAAKGEGVEELAVALDRHAAHLEVSGELARRRTERMVVRTREVIDRAVRRWMWLDGQKEEMAAVLRDVGAGIRSPYEAAARVIARLQGSVAYERD
jgi:LAO/AO transport system kinase